MRLADAAEAFGKGREAQNFRPRGAREVRRAAAAFLEMKGRVERAIEQRTTMLAGVSHDLRTILTRFKLELALLGDGPEIDAIKKDVDEMAAMLEAYLAFARGDMGEQSAPTDMAALLDELKLDTERHGHRASVNFHGQPRSHGAAGGVQTLPRQSRHQCLAFCLDRGDYRPPRSPLAHGHGGRRRAGHPAANCARTCSSRSCGSTTRAIRMKAAPAWASPSRATSRAPMAATSRSATARSGGLRATVRVPV